MGNKKIIAFGQDARNKIVVGVEKSTSVVGSTLGPKGRHVGIDSAWGEPKITKDGVTVNNNISLPDPFENFGSKLARSTAKKTDETVGDGTTTTNILFGYMLKEAHKACTAGAKPTDITKGLKRGVDVALKELSVMTKKIQSRDEIAQVGTISANGDKNVGDIIAEAMDAVGNDGVITVEEGKGLMALELEVVTGVSFNRGYASPHFTTNTEKMMAELDNPYILLLDKKLSSLQQILPLLEATVQSTRPLLIVAEDIEGEALATLVLNKLRASLRVAAVKAPGFGERRKEMLQDMAIATGGQLISDDMGIKLEAVTLEMLGSAKKINITKDSTTIIEGKGDPADIEARANQIRAQIATSTSDYDKEKLQERLARLTGGIALIRIGGDTELEVKERKDRVDDALNATRAAVEEGVIPGGGAALFYTAYAVEKLISDADNEDEETGIKIITKVLRAPLCTIVTNAGMDSGVVVSKLLERNDNQYIFDARNMQYVNAFEAGIIDPVKVMRVALKDSSSVASIVITTEAIITESDDKSDGESGSGEMGGMPPMGMGGMGL